MQNNPVIENNTADPIIATDRGCNGCIACCDGTLTFDTVTQSGKRIIANQDHKCFYCGSKGEGCTGYDDRPSSCEEFRCEYLADSGLPEFLSPKRCGFILINKLGDPEVKGWIVRDAKSYDLDWYALYWVVAWANETGRDLFVSLDKHGQKFFKNS